MTTRPSSDPETPDSPNLRPPNSLTASSLTASPSPELPPSGRNAPSRSPNSLTANSLTAWPLPEMSSLDRTLADYRTLGLTTGPHLISFLRAELSANGIIPLRDLPKVPTNTWIRTAGLVIVRQRPGSAKGFCFLTLEDETGIGNAVVTPDLFQRHRTIIHTAALLCLEGPLQTIEGVTHVRARRFTPLRLPAQAITQTGHGYRMRVTPDDEDDPPPLPKSHDFR